MKKVFYTTILVVLGLIVLDYINFGQVVCGSPSCLMGVDTFFQGVFLNSVLVIILLVVLKLLPDSSFTSWWKFAKFAIPLILLSIVIISLGLHHSPGGWFNMNNEVDIVMMAIVFLLFFLGSVVQIIRGYRQK